MPLVLADLLRRGRSTGEVTTVNSTMIDAIARKVLGLVFADHPALDPRELTWLSLGSNGRREPVLGSDIDAAVVFAETVGSADRMAAYRTAFDEVGALLTRCGALRPVVDIARWAALAVGSTEPSTSARLAAAAGSAMVPHDQADILVEVVEVLQKIRLRYQLAQIDRGEAPSDLIVIGALSPLERSLVSQAVREVAAVQRRMSNIAQLTSPDSWSS